MNDRKHDEKLAKQLKKAGDMLGVELLDFIAVGSIGSYESAAEHGLLD